MTFRIVITKTQLLSSFYNYQQRWAIGSIIDLVMGTINLWPLRNEVLWSVSSFLSLWARCYSLGLSGSSPAFRKIKTNSQSLISKKWLFPWLRKELEHDVCPMVAELIRPSSPSLLKHDRQHFMKPSAGGWKEPSYRTSSQFIWNFKSELQTRNYFQWPCNFTFYFHRSSLRAIVFLDAIFVKKWSVSNNRIPTYYVILLSFIVLNNFWSWRPYGYDLCFWHLPIIIAYITMWLDIWFKPIVMRKCTDYWRAFELLLF